MLVYYSNFQNVITHQPMPKILATKLMSSSLTPQARKMGMAVAMTNKNLASLYRSSRCESRSWARSHFAGFEFRKAKSLSGTTMA